MRIETRNQAGNEVFPEEVGTPGRFARSVAFVDIDVTRRAEEELAQSAALREQMMGIVGHDLRNPLSSVLALATLLL